MATNINEAAVLSTSKGDAYPYYIPIIRSIKKIISPTPTNISATSVYDEFHCVLHGTATYEIIHYKTGESTIITVKDNDVIFFTCGMQRYILREASKDYEYLEISFYIFTYNTFSDPNVLNFSQILSSPINHQRMYLGLPRVTHCNKGDEIFNCVAAINKYRNFTEKGYLIQLQTHLLQLISFTLLRTEEITNKTLKNTNIIAISSKYNYFASMPKGSKIFISDIRIRNNNPNKEKSDVLSVFFANNSSKLSPNNDDLILNTFYDNKISENFLELTATEETNYHVWLSSNKNSCTLDLRKYFKTGYLEFYAKSNIENRFDIVLYNTDNNCLINYTVHITPSITYTKYSIPLRGGDNQISQSPEIHEAINYIIQNYSQKIRVEDIANQIHMNPSYVSTKFKNEIGISISDYLLNYRLSIAKKLLVDNSNASVCDIAIASGFYDSAHFSKCFKTAFGITALQYRKQNTTDN